MSGKRIAGPVIVLGTLAVGAWVVLFHSAWLKPATHEEEEGKVDTEVAVRVAKITRATLRRSVEAFGTVQAEPATDGKPPASARVASPVAGLVAESFAVEGREVKKGDPLFQLDDRIGRGEEEKAQAAVERAKLGVEFALKAFERQKKLMAEDATAGRKLEESEFQVSSARGELTAAEKVLSASKMLRSLHRILAPLSGVVTKVRVNPGEAVDTNAPLADVIDLERLIVLAQVPSGELGALKRGQPVDIDGDGGAIVKGKLDFIGLDVDPKTDSTGVRISLPPGNGLRPGKYVRARIQVEERRDRLAVPKGCVVLIGEGGGAISVVDGGKAVAMRVKAGLWDGDLIEVEGEGLSEGQVVVTAGAYGLPKATKVRVLGE